MATPLRLHWYVAPAMLPLAVALRVTLEPSQYVVAPFAWMLRLLMFGVTESVRVTVESQPFADVRTCV